MFVKLKAFYKAHVALILMALALIVAYFVFIRR